MSFLQRRGSSSSQGPASGSCAATAADLARFPALLEFVSAERWPDGEAREPGTVLVFVEAGALKACVSDRAQQAVAFVTAGESGLGGLLDRLESLLASGGLDWRGSRPRGKR